MNLKSSLPKIAVGITFAVALILCVKHIGEPDVWWQIRTGEYVLEHGEVPKVDVFSYTYEGDPWINVKWFTEVVMASFSKVLGPEFLMLQQAIALIAMCLLMFLTAQRYAQFAGKSLKLFHPGALLAMLLVLIGMSFRINGRPEMVSHVFTCLYLFLMADYRYKPGKRVFIFIPAMMLWANMHEAFGVGVVLLLLFNGISWVESFIQKKDAHKFERKDLIRLSLTSAVAILATAIHPSGTKMLSHPFEIYGQLGDNKFTSELFGWRNPEFWNLGSFMALILFACCLIYMFRNFKAKKEFAMKTGLALVVIFMALTYLTLQAYRNVPFFLFVSFPLAALFIAEAVKEKALTWTVVVGGLLLYGSIGSGKFYESVLPLEKYGLRVDPSRNPIGASNFIEEHEIGGNGFVDYLSSSYLLWDLAPDYKTYIDLRDLDVFEGTFMDNILASYVYPGRKLQSGKGLFQTLDELDSFNYVLMVNKAQFAPILKHLNKSKNYELVYTDLSTSLFLKRNEENAAIIEQYGNLKMDQKFQPHASRETPTLAKVINKVFWPFYSELDYETLDYGNGKQVLKEMLKK